MIMRATLTDPTTQQRIRFDEADLVALLSQLSQGERVALERAVREHQVKAALEKERVLNHQISRLTETLAELEEGEGPSGEPVRLGAQYTAIYTRRVRLEKQAEAAHQEVAALRWSMAEGNQR